MRCSSLRSKELQDFNRQISIIDRTAEIAVALVDAYWHPPRVGDVRRRPRGYGHEHVERANVDPAAGITLQPSVRVPLEWEVTGNERWLMWWPDETTQEPVDAIFPRPETTSEHDRAEWNRLVELSTNLFLLTGSKVTSFVEVPVNPSPDADATAVVRRAVEERDALLRGYVDAIEPTVTSERSRILTTVTEAVRYRRSELSWFAAVDDALTLIPESTTFEAAVTHQQAVTNRESTTRDLDVLPQITEATFDRDRRSHSAVA